MRLFLVSILAMMTAGAVAADDTALREEANAIFNPLPHSPPTLAGNPFNTDKVELGKLLFFDPRLSSSGAISCSTCRLKATHLRASVSDILASNHDRPIVGGHAGRVA